MAIYLWIAILTIIRVTNSKLTPNVSKLRAEVKRMQGNTKDLLDSLDKLELYSKKGDATDVHSKRLEKANAVVDGTLKAIPKFKSEDPAQVISGVLDMTSMALSTFGGRKD